MGVESVFVRVSGCNLRCGYCDTPYASWKPEGEDYSVREILDCISEIRSAPRPAFLEGLMPSSRVCSGNGESGAAAPTADVRHVVLTGGEPMQFPDVVPLCAELRAGGWHVTIETAGTVYRPVACDLMSVSPKLSNSSPTLPQHAAWVRIHGAHRHAPHVIQRLAGEYSCQWKFVIDTPKDCDEVMEYLTQYPAIDRTTVMLMPQGTDATALAEKGGWLVPFCEANGFAYCPRRQIEWFGSKRGR